MTAFEPLDLRGGGLRDEDLGALRRRLARAQAGDRELDGRVLCGLFGHRFLAWDEAGLLYARDDEDGPIRLAGAEVAPLTASLDAAAALLALILPDWSLALTIRPDGSTAELTEDPPPFRRGRVWRGGAGADGAARAVLQALLEALESLAEGA